MKQTIYESDFIEAFKRMGRENQFSREGLMALFEYLESTETEENQMELDVVGLCCEFQEFEDLTEYNKEHGTDYENINDIEEVIADIDGNSFICYSH